ncbi:MAG: FAD-dependent oxidoreductase [Desulfobacula sp.]|nr:FAD-dependent oxidoreductase [Desulfobacula sp.]
MKYVLMVMAAWVCLSLSIVVSAKEATLLKNGSSFDVVIIGGGIAGLTAAYYLKDYNIKVIEKRSAVGGRAFSLPHKEFVFACGAEYLGRLYGPLEKIVRELDLTVREIPYPMDVYSKGRRFYYGEMGRAILASEKVGLNKFKLFGKTVQKIYSSYKDVPEFNFDDPIARLDNITAYDWFLENGFPKFFMDKYNVTFKGLFGADIHEISALSSLTEIAFDYENVDMDAEFARQDDLENDPTPGKYRTGAYSFDNGIAQIPSALAKHLGSRILTDSTVIDVKQEEDTIITTFLTKNSKKVSIESEAVVLATPAPVTLNIAQNILTREQQKILKTVKYAPFITLALFSSKPIFNRGFDLAIPNNLFFTDIYDATWIPRFYNKALKNVKTYITTVYISAPSYKDRSILTLSNKQIIDSVYPDMEKILPGSKGKVEGYKIFRFEHGYPVMTKGAYGRLTRLYNITKAPIVLAGDYTIYPTFEAAADSGVIAADKIQEWMEE